MFAALLEQMKKMNENILNINEPVDLEDELSSNDGNDANESLETRVAKLTADSNKEPNILADIARDLDASEKTGPAASDDLAGIVNSLLKEKLPEEKIQQKVDMYPRPQNVTGLRTPHVNPLIWGQISAPSKTNDSKTQKSQNAIVAGVVAMIKATDTILKSELKDNKELIKLMTDAMALTLQGHHDLNTARRKAMKNDLNKDYAALCSSSPMDQASEYLFGDLSNYVSGVKISFEENLSPVQTHYRPSVFNLQEQQIVQQEITTLLSKGVIQRSFHEPGEYISTIFVRPKADGSYRMILNLKEFNQSVEYHHFKMDTLDTVLKMVKPGCYMASVDLKDAYYTVPIHKDHQKFLKFEFKGCLYKYTCLPNGLSSAPRVFTKMLKPVFSTLHNQGYVSVGYIDDSYLQGDSISECRQNILCTARIFTELGFYIHPHKSVFIPSQKLTFLGFIIDSINMIVSPTPEKIEKTVKACEQLLRKKTPCILDLARVIGLIISLFPGAEYGPLHYRVLENDKTTALKNNSGNFSASMKISVEAMNELRWWIMHAQQAKKCISYPTPTLLLQSDASKKGWGAVLNGRKIGGRWTPSEACKHINILELQAALFGLKSFAEDYKQTHIQLQLDNTTAVAYINNMGGSKSIELNNLAKELWEWPDSTLPPEDKERQDTRNFNSATIAKPAMVPSSTATTLQTSLDCGSRQEIDSAHSTSGTTSTMAETQTDDIIMASWRNGTQKQYKTYIQKWINFCSERQTDCYSPQINEALEFLAMLYATGLSYSTLNTARSALSSILQVKDCVNFGSHPLTVRFMKGVFEKRTPQPRYDRIWDASIVLDYLDTLNPVEKLQLKDLTLKLLMLFLLVTGKRGQSIHLLNVTNMCLGETSCSFQLTSHTTTSKPGQPTTTIRVQEFNQDRGICPIHTLREYIRRTKPMRGNHEQLFLSFVKPHKPVSRDTISRWTKTVLQKSGIDTTMFTSHSTRAASASKAKQKDVPLDVILSHVGWSTTSTFTKFYDKPIRPHNDIMASAVLTH
ncbi:Transposon Tf2-6 polyprotein [Exaiptasia diaphana]|nr:Transposon Tf2-6 polyprotein [Exaiptasia diaphana]